ncbi:hypothetical protein [Rufibacter roseus]|uniref:Lipocalin-like domain-containing protein n=1 Tax=Rufibacter roseus TaxID=1567108 RepID=A0ABW2DL64_9BACT|nr:hypothetical protein [Rufibacter roseus]
MKNLSSVLVLLALGLMASKCGNRLNVPETVYGQTWLYSYEEDSADVRTYRPNTFDFPPSRGRTGFMLLKDGNFIRYGIAPADGLEEQPGKWESQGKKQIRIQFNNQKHKPEEIEILLAEPEVMKIRRKTTTEQ